MILILLGAPGSGKGTQASVLRERLGFVHLNVGEMFRNMNVTNPDLFAFVQPIMARGDLIPDSVVSQLVASKLASLPADTNVVLDGCPRSVEQALALESIPFIENSEVHVLSINVPTELLVRRMKVRGRADDTDETIVNRLKVYNESTVPVKDHYKSKGQLVEVDGTMEINDIHHAVRRKINL